MFKKHRRKSPIRHKVRRHLRKGRSVREHMRGVVRVTGIGVKRIIPQKLQNFRKEIKRFSKRKIDVRVERDAKKSDRLFINKLIPTEELRPIAEKIFGKDNIVEVYGVQSVYPGVWYSIVKIKKGIV